MSLPVTAPGPASETIRTAARRRFLYSAAFLALGAAVLAVAQTFLVVLAPVGVLTGLIVGALLQVLGLGSGAYAAVLLRRAFPLSEAAQSSRLTFLATLAVVLPVCVGATAAYALVAFPEPPNYAPTALVLIPALPFFWGPTNAVASLGLLHAARELTSPRMALIAAVGCGALIAMAFSAGGGALADPVGALRSARLTVDLFLVAVGDILIAAAFQYDAWAARSRPSA